MLHACLALVLFSLSTVASEATLASTSKASPQSHTELIDGRLDKDDPTLKKGGESFDVHQVEVTESGPFTVRLTGSFDGYLIVQPPDYRETKTGQLENDDWQGDLTESRVQVENARPGTWTIVVTTASAGVGGSYQLALELPGPWQAATGTGVQLQRQAAELTDQDPTLQNGEHFDQFELALGAGESLVVSMASKAFDTYLILADAEMNSVAQNDDHEGSTALSRVEYTAETAASLLLIATSARSGETGTYELTIERTPPGGASGAAPSVERLSGSLKPGDDTLDPGRYVDIINRSGVAGARLTVDLTSRAFDPYLIIGDSAGDLIEMNDDFEGDSSHSRVVFTVPADGGYNVAVSSYGQGEGAYEIAFSTAAGSAPEPAAAALPETDGPPTERTESGRLGPGDDSLDSGEYTDAFPMEVDAGDSLVFELVSSDFDAFLIVMPVEGDPIQQDDSDGGSDPVIEYQPEAAGKITVIVTSARVGEQGAYTLTIRQRTSAGGDNPLTTFNGSLGEGDDTLGSGEYIELHQCEMTAGVTYLVSMSSSEFDTYLGIVSPSGKLQEDDDGGENGNSFLMYVAEETGRYRLTATSAKPGEQGSYEIMILPLELDDGAASSTTDTTPEPEVPSLPLGRPVEGRLASSDATLENGEFRDAWVFQASKGQAVSFEVSSNEFDTYMVLIDSDDNILQNDDLDGARDKSGIEWTAPADGPVVLLVTSYRKGETGGYSLIARSGGAATASASISGRVYGVFLGVSDYPGTDNDLPLCDRDAVRLQQALVEHAGMQPEDGVVLINREVRGDNVRAAVHRTRSRLQDGDLFVFFYSGHGKRVKRTELVAHDPDGHDALDEALVLYDGLLLDDELDTLLAAEERGTTLVILDSCFSGGFSKDVISRPGRMGLFSSHEDVTSATAAKFKAGGFLAAFAAEALSSGSAIADENGDGLLDAAELSQYIYESYRNELVRSKAVDYLDVGDNLGYQQLIVDRGGVGVKQPLFRLD